MWDHYLLGVPDVKGKNLINIRGTTPETLKQDVTLPSYSRDSNDDDRLLLLPFLVPLLPGTCPCPRNPPEVRNGWNDKTESKE